MTKPSTVDKTFHSIMRRMVETGEAPFYTEIAADFITSFAPFNNLPTQHQITVNGQQKWFAQ